MKFFLPLNEKESARLYWELSRRGAVSVGQKTSWRYESLSEEGLLTLAVLQSRYDPRLLEVLIDFFAGEKFRGDPIRFKEYLSKEKGLTPMAVIGEFVLESTRSRPVNELMKYLMTGAKPYPTQLYFPGLYRLGGKKMGEAIERPPWGFKKWGFLAADPPFSKEHSKKVYLFDADSRKNLLRRLAEEKGRFRLKDYLAVVGHSISRQQALKDLKKTVWIGKRGAGKGSFYLLKQSPQSVAGNGAVSSKGRMGCEPPS